MTFKKIHRRADLDQFRRAPVSEAATTTHVSAASDTHNINPQGPPLVATSSPAAAAATTTSTSSVPTTSASTSTSAAPITTSTSSVPTTPPAASSAPVAHVSNPPSEVITHTATSHITATGTRSTASATATSDASSGMGMGSIIGIGVAAVIGIGVITAFIIWRIKRRNKNRDLDEEPFNRNSFLRNSTAIPDDDAPLPSRIRPTAPPSMAERQPTPLYGQQQAFGADPSGFNYTPQPSYGVSPGQTFNPGAFGPGGAPATPLPHSPGFGTAYDQQGFNNGGYQELTRGPGIHDYPPSPASRGFEPQMENPHSPGYNGHDSFPMPPHGHGHEIQHRSMTPAQQGHVVNINNSPHDGRETPVQLGFAPAHPPAHGRAPGARPETVYDDDDAYGGI